jgi:hypothetical protein
VSYRPWLGGQALRQMRGLPDDALDMLARLVARICGDPYERLYSKAVGEDPHERMAELGDAGWIEFQVDEKDGVIRIYALVWVG